MSIVSGLVGGIASGKSAVAVHINAECRATHLDADSIARRVMGQAAVREAVARRFPAAVGRDGKMDREKLAGKVFSSRRSLAALEAITHPPIRRAIVRAIRRADTPFVVLDAPLLQETGADDLCDVVVYVACPARVRRARARRRGLSDAEHRARESHQWSCRRKRARADLVVDNGGYPARTRRQVRRALRQIRGI